MTPPPLQPFAPQCVKPLPSPYWQRWELNRKYLLSLTAQNLLNPHYLEAGLWAPNEQPKDIHWGWESPTCQLRGEFVGHWLWGAAHIVATTGDPELRGRIEYIVGEIARCQQENGGEWAGSIPEKYLHWAARGKYVWAPHYVIHKQLIGLLAAHMLLGNAQALDICTRWAAWFHRWTGGFSREQMDNLLDVETGGMLEAWADLYGVTGDAQHLELVQRYYRGRLFDRLLAGEDPLTNMHANTQIPEIAGAARAFEVTGEQRYRDIVEAYWRSAVTERGTYCTGGQTCGEVWTPAGQQAARLGDKNQEHCTVFNMMRLAAYLYRWTGDPVYADYWERNLLNGVMAQQNPQTGMITYFLPLRAGSTKKWGSATNDFWCCHGTLVQAHTFYNQMTFHADAAGLTIGQYIPGELTWTRDGQTLKVTLTHDYQKQYPSRPHSVAFDVTITTPQPVAFTLSVRMPEWLAGQPTVTLNGQPHAGGAKPRSFLRVQRTWATGDRLHVELPTKLWTCPLPDEPDTVAFMDGPVVLAALADTTRPLYGDPRDPTTLLTPDNEREWGLWRIGYRTRDDGPGLRFVPFHEIVDERYTVYFPVRPARR